MSFSPYSFSDVNSKLYPEDLHSLFSFPLSTFYRVYVIILQFILSFEVCICVCVCVFQMFVYTCAHRGQKPMSHVPCL